MTCRIHDPNLKPQMSCRFCNPEGRQEVECEDNTALPLRGAKLKRPVVMYPTKLSDLPKRKPAPKPPSQHQLRVHRLRKHLGAEAPRARAQQYQLQLAIDDGHTEVQSSNRRAGGR